MPSPPIPPSCSCWAGGIFLYGLLYNYMYAPNLVRKAPVAVVDLSHSALSREYIRLLRHHSPDRRLRPDTQHPRSPPMDEAGRRGRHPLPACRLRGTCGTGRDFGLRTLCRHGRFPQLQRTARIQCARHAAPVNHAHRMETVFYLRKDCWQWLRPLPSACPARRSTTIQRATVPI